jgi:hypothetical protein
MKEFVKSAIHYIHGSDYLSLEHEAFYILRCGKFCLTGSVFSVALKAIHVRVTESRLFRVSHTIQCLSDPAPSDLGFGSRCLK